MGLVSTGMNMKTFYLASVLSGFKKFCIWRVEMLIYLLKVLLFEIKIIW